MMSIFPLLEDKPDSPIAYLLVPSWGTQQNVYRRRTEDAVATVVHTTGYGIIKRWLKLSEAARTHITPLDVAVEVFRSGKTGTAAANYVVGQCGKCVQTVPEKFIAHHVGTAGGQRYLRSDWDRGLLAKRRYAWWRSRWALDASPTALASGKLWRNGSCNRNTYAIEVVPPMGGPKESWSSECWSTVARLIFDIHTRRSIELAEAHVPSHSDSHPFDRTTLLGEPWDPWPSQWSWDQICLELKKIGAFGPSPSPVPMIIR